jgi:hypothetical protein
MSFIQHCDIYIASTDSHTHRDFCSAGIDHRELISRNFAERNRDHSANDHTNVHTASQHFLPDRDIDPASQHIHPGRLHYDLIAWSHCRIYPVQYDRFNIASADSHAC